MPCFAPLSGWVSRKRSKKGRNLITFDVSESIGQAMEVACGQCTGCRLDKSREWAVRIVHEQSLHDDCHFLTLTYNDDHLPEYGGLKIQDLQRFWKRLRKNTGQVFSYFACGEYGSELGRPHYHAIVFGLSLTDLRLWKVSGSGERLYRSPTIEKSWKLGFSSVGAVTFESAAYVARYSLKKRYGEEADRWYTKACDYTGECFQVVPEFTVSSKRPGIGKRYWKKYKKAIVEQDSVTYRSRKGDIWYMKPPRYYDRLLDQENPEALDEVKRKRRQKAKARKDGPSAESRERVMRARLAKLHRSLDDEVSSD